MMCHEGLGTEMNYEEAARYLQLAADQGVASAQNNLALLYIKGEGVPQDNELATMWLRAAADQGLAIAAERLQMMQDPFENDDATSSSVASFEFDDIDTP